jgi:hypothetical protein
MPFKFRTGHVGYRWEMGLPAASPPLIPFGRRVDASTRFARLLGQFAAGEGHMVTRLGRVARNAVQWPA